MIYLYFIIVILFFYILRSSGSTNPIWCDILLSLFWAFLISIILIGLLIILIFNLILELKN